MPRTGARPLRTAISAARPMASAARPQPVAAGTGVGVSVGGAAHAQIETDWVGVGGGVGVGVGIGTATEFDGSDDTLLPTSLAAVTAMVYVWPEASPLTTALNVEPPTVAVLLSGLEVAVY